MKIGDKIKISSVNYMSKDEQKKLRDLNFVVTIDDLDIINNRIYGFYSKEIPGYLFTMEQI